MTRLDMGLELSFIKTGQYMKATGKIMNVTELVEYGKKMVIFIRANGRITLRMGRVFLNLRMAI